MTVNVKNLQDHVRRVMETHVSEIDQVTLLAQIGISQEIIRGLNLPVPPATAEIAIRTADDLENRLLQLDEPWETRYRLTRQLDRLLAHAIKHPGGIKRCHRLHSSLMDDVRRTALADTHQLSVVGFMDSKYGRDALKRWGKAAREAHPDDLDSFHAMVSKGLDEARIVQFETYIDSQFPPHSEAPPTLSEADAITLAREYCMLWMAQNGKDSLSTISDPETRILQVMINGMRENRWELPLVEGILTPDYWQGAINNGLKVDLPDRQYILREQCPLQTVLDAYQQQTLAGGLGANRGDVVVHYLDDHNGQQFEFCPTELIGGAGNHIAVMRGVTGPEIVYRLHPDVDNFLVVTAPNRTIGVMDAAPYVRDPEALKDAISRIAKNLPYKAKPDQLANEIVLLQEDLVNAGTTADTSGVNRLIELQGRIIEAAKCTRPNQPQALELAKLALVASGGDNFESKQLQFAVDPNLGNLIQENGPHAELILSQNSDGSLDVMIAKATAQGASSKADILAARKGIFQAELTPTVSELMNTLGLGSIGKRTTGVPGMSVVAPTAAGKMVRVGHWLDAPERAELSQRSAVEILAHAQKTQGDRFRTGNPDQIIRIKEGLVGALHGSHTHPEELNDIYDELDFSGDLIMPAEAGDKGEHKAIHLNPYVFTCLNDQEIRAAVNLKVLQAGLSNKATKEIVNTVNTADWTESAEPFISNPASPGMA